MNMKNNKRKKDSMKKIEQAFAELIQTREIKEVSITDICKRAHVNRSTFYASYLDIFDLIDKIRERMIDDYLQLYNDEVVIGYHSSNYLKLFRHIKENQIFYNTYFKLQLDMDTNVFSYNTEYAKTYYDNKHIEYHMDFFKAGITAIIKKWLHNNCDIEPEEVFEIIKSEYRK